MDILIKLRVLLWTMVLALWGLMIYQFLGEESNPKDSMRWVSSRVAVDALEELPDLESLPKIPMDELFSSTEQDDLTPTHAGGAITPDGGPRPASAPVVASLPKPARQTPFPAAKPMPKELRIAPAKSYRGVAPEKERTAPGRSLGETPVRPVPQPPRRPPEAASPGAPKGFVKIQNEHFVIFSQGQAPSQEFVETLEDLHENLMKDLASFSPWARNEKVSVFLFRDQESYQKVTGRPSWSGGASSVKRRKIYVYASEELVGILAHELTHIYFDSFFLAGKESPLWLSEGMATLVQTERGLAAPNWLRGNLDTLRAGGGYDLRDLMRVDSTGGAKDNEVRLWYTQAYSVVRFMIRTQRRASFYKFCRAMRDGARPKTALYRAYGMPFNSLHALEYAWRHQVEQG
ncbi:MAG: hypothetical protein AUJ52_00200 [Elusimicrobia bacterium CG1_02_63_36]|nr:MAG: hypothetical protein AUJ52_00200 [Elusimicrobia bacterium CG1_02_63_36]PIP84728.1 MAG: hypothetical protein COR54_02515 [Elusimicrobia bacterium CG22_combo_CG10-13_8_21_14_all_63_91]PJA16641.1 MAG: hypothetical protein COX66_07075 [Elusimicrobia bacterium CG_4_10_14_0_2_um_filter_63_34]PJB26432.1 MAG: hypothetical protein CO113_03660 [Elusimicrobia bacterium CG_4_9_14_3_um_filter_62_55]